MKKTNKKGFTLVELLGVLIILTIIILVLFPTISTYINNTKEKSFDSEMKIITTSLKNYAEGHKEILPLGEGEYVVLTLGQLKDFGIVSSILKNPLDGKQISDSMEVRITKHNASYTYEVDEISISPRDDDLLSPTITLKGNLLKYYDINDNYTEDGAIARDSNGEILNVEIDKSNIFFSFNSFNSFALESLKLSRSMESPHRNLPKNRFLFSSKSVLRCPFDNSYGISLIA